MKRPLHTGLFAMSLVICLSQWGHAAWIGAKAYAAEWLLNSAWEATLAAPAQLHKPWQWADTWPVAKLSFQTQDASIAADWVVLANAQAESLAFAPTMIASGEATSANWWVVAGHRDTHFGFLQYAELGDRFTLMLANGEQHIFTLAAVAIHDVGQGELMLNPEQAQLVLITCYPFGDWRTNSPYRFVAYASPEETLKPNQTALSF